MLYIYCRQHCTSSPKAIQWLTKYRIKFIVKSSGLISREELITVLTSTDNGFDDLLRHPSKVKEEDLSKLLLIQKMPLNQAIDYIKVNPNLLKSPIMIEKNKVLIGYDSEQIRMFLPQKYRRKLLFRS